MKRFTHDADLRGMVVLRSLGFQLVPFKLHRFRKQRRCSTVASYCKDMGSCEEAEFALEQCGRSRLDRDKDGIPCENVCG
ncbi:excalibur calcium-binding domain-containing protein [Aeromonas salmonicida]|uniref:excalibur calcium-binding domain-containing protein n=1 Tax=Aeromonas salmonicida TaxID=645 RepID=UPI001950A473|nr:excalibur calcium-binding domain-containing protein [Aeromonas salmonicida]